MDRIDLIIKRSIRNYNKISPNLNIADRVDQFQIFGSLLLFSNEYTTYKCIHEYAINNL